MDVCNVYEGIQHVPASAQFPLGITVTLDNCPIYLQCQLGRSTNVLYSNIYSNYKKKPSNMDVYIRILRERNKPALPPLSASHAFSWAPGATASFNVQLPVGMSRSGREFAASDDAK